MNRKQDDEESKPQEEIELDDEEEDLHISEHIQACIPDCLKMNGKSNDNMDRDNVDIFSSPDSSDNNFMADEIKVLVLACGYNFTWYSRKPLYELCQCFKNARYHQPGRRRP